LRLYFSSQTTTGISQQTESAGVTADTHTTGSSTGARGQHSGYVTGFKPLTDTLFRCMFRQSLPEPDSIPTRQCSDWLSFSLTNQLTVFRFRSSACIASFWRNVEAAGSSDGRGSESGPYLASHSLLLTRRPLCYKKRTIYWSTL
jgi:hypothetical protein